MEDGRPVYRTTAEQFASHLPALIEAGANFVGGCCGTGPEFIRAAGDRLHPGVNSMKLKLISCEVLYREMCAVIARSPNEVDVEFLPKGLHDIGCNSMRKRLQDAVDRVDPECYEAVLLGYALCGNGTAGLTARTRCRW